MRSVIIAMAKNILTRLFVVSFFIMVSGTALYADDVYNKNETGIPDYMSGKNAPFTPEEEDPAEAPEEITPEETQVKEPEEEKPGDQQSKFIEEKKAVKARLVSSQKNGRLEIYPYIHPHSRINILYDDNIFNAQEVTKKKFDMVTIVDPGISFMIGRKDKINVQLDGGVRYDTYYINSYLNQVKPFYYFGGIVQMASRYNKLEVSYNIKRLPAWTSNFTQGGYGITSYVYNRADARWKYSKKWLALDCSYSFKDYSYESNSSKINNYSLNDINFTVYAKTRFLPKAQFLFETNIETQNSYKASPDVMYSDSSYEDYKLYFGIKGRIRNRLNGLLKIGYELRHYDKQIAPNTSNTRNNLIYSAELNYLYSKKTTLYFSSYLNDVAGGSYRGHGMQKRYYYSLWCKYFIGKFTYLAPRIYYMVDEYDVGGTAATPGFSFETKYSPYKWIDVTLKYDWLYRDSDLSGNSYKNNVLSLGANMRF